jgi:uncharacterized membrane protein YfcA
MLLSVTHPQPGPSSTMHPISDPLFYAAAIPAVFLVGMSKGGFGGTLAMLGVPLMALVISPIQGAGIMLPILIVMDAVALFAYRGTFDRKSLMILMPAGIFGIGIGWATAAYVDENFITLMVGVISLLFVANYLHKRKSAHVPAEHNRPKGYFWGTVSGFTSFVSHTGGPPYQLYMVPLRLTPTLFAGTGAIYFATLNFLKLIPYFMLGQFETTNLVTSGVLLPIAPVATLTGVWLVRVVDPGFFYRVIYVLMGVIGDQGRTTSGTRSRSTTRRGRPATRRAWSTTIAARR